MYKNILLASDGSDHSIRAADHAIHIATCNENASLTILYVESHRDAKTNTLQNWNSPEGFYVLDDKFAEIEEKARKANINYHVATIFGEAGTAIVEHANNGDFDMVIVGSRGLNGFQEMMLGSVSHKVAKRVQCPVLIIK
ncbi:universal stress protein [Pontibacillus yanchengensis]|uniref:Universal stress protein n=1 Tax=Pontibacillus yanchengensis Y32 TaxID=1385514 RepID=A0A0A2TIQ2_9BACI|nr:universal stress protein [Pontibacillus yanchengensis]KGP74318.1 universal stress protein [Pontibacillus yanchengensis Y32]